MCLGIVNAVNETLLSSILCSNGSTEKALLGRKSKWWVTNVAKSHALPNYHSPLLSCYSTRNLPSAEASDTRTDARVEWNSELLGSIKIGLTMWITSCTRLSSSWFKEYENDSLKLTVSDLSHKCTGVKLQLQYIKWIISYNYCCFIVTTQSCLPIAMM